MRKYQAVLFAPDGEWVTDYRDSPDIETVWERVADQGSRWFFYPYVVVVRSHGEITTDRQRIADAPDVFDDMEGRTIRAFGKMLASLPYSTHEALLT